MTVTMMRELLRMGCSLLALDAASTQGQPFVVVTRDNLMDVATSVASCRPGVYHDPERLLDAAIVDKMIMF